MSGSLSAHRPATQKSCIVLSRISIDQVLSIPRRSATGGPPISQRPFQPAPSPAVHEVDRLVRESADQDHAHVAGVVTVSDSGERDWELDEFVQAIRLGERFYVRESGVSLELDLVVCDRCPRLTISPLTRPRKG